MKNYFNKEVSTKEYIESRMRVDQYQGDLEILNETANKCLDVLEKLVIVLAEKNVLTEDDVREIVG